MKKKLCIFLIFILLIQTIVFAEKSIKITGAYIFGKTDTEMAPDDYLERQEAAAMIYRILKQNNMLDGFEYNINNEPTVKNLKGLWSRSAMEFMYYKGVYSIGEIKDVNEPIKRKEVFRMIAICLGYAPNSISEGKASNILKKKGFIIGYEDGGMRLGNNLTRAEFCTIFNKIIKRDKCLLNNTNNEKINSDFYGFKDLNPKSWYYEIILKATSAYNDKGLIDKKLRVKRNEIDDWR